MIVLYLELFCRGDETKENTKLWLCIYFSSFFMNCTMTLIE